MFKRLLAPGHIIFFLIIFLNNTLVFGQVRNNGRDWIKTQAYRDFNAGAFEKAFIGFSELLTRYPQEPMYHLFKGACQVELQIELDEAVGLLEYAIEQGARPDAHYFLGKAHLKLYRFDAAAEQLAIFRKKADKRLQESYAAGLWVNMVDKARELTAKPWQVEVLQTEEMPFTELAAHYDLSSLGGQIVADSAVLDGELEDLELAGDPVFTHESDLHYLYFSARSRKGKGSYDIYRMKYRRGRVYGSPERLPSTINTGRDERYPFYDRQDKLLYFSSEGHESMGGLDIYLSSYDSRKKKWSDPEQLGFPVNSTSDDFLYVSRYDSNSILFASAREVASGYIQVFRIAEKDFPAMLDPVPEDYDPASYAALVAPVEHEALTLNLSAGSDAFETAEELINDAKYNALINASLRMQARSDSFASTAKQMRQELGNIENPSERGLLQKLILQMEEQARSYRQQADSTYQHARDYEAAILQEKQGNAYIVPDRTVSGITVYRYRSSAGEGSDVDSNNLIPGNPVIYESVGDFRIHMYPPYSASNPVPFNEKLTGGILYRIQLGAFANPVDFNYFRGISPISAERKIDGPLTRYYAGKFTTYQDARKALDMVRDYGFEDAFLVAYINTNKLPVPKVKEYEEQLRDYYE